MKNLRISIAMIIFVMVLSLTTGVFAYGGTGDVDPDMNIGMPSTLTDGKGNVSGVSSSMKYQFIEITQDKYNKIKLLEDEYDLMVIYEDWAENPDDAQKTEAYNKACEKFEASHNVKVSDITAKYGITEDLTTLIRADWIAELTSFDASKWESANGTQIVLDLSAFKGTKYFIGWIEVGSIHDAEAYKVTGTQKDAPAPTEQPEDPKEPEIPVNTVTPENTVKPENKEEPTTTPVNISQPKEDKTISNTTNLPYTGATDALPVIMLAVIAVALGFYKKYTDIK